MPSPKDAQKTSTKKSPGGKETDLGQTLAKRKSQDFKAKIAGWNETGAGIAQEDDGVPTVGQVVNDADQDHAVIESTPRKKKGKLKESEEMAEDKENATPISPAAGDNGVTKQASSRKASREVDFGKKVWVRRRSKPQPEGSPNNQPEELPDVKTKASPAAKTRPSPDVKHEVSPAAKHKDSAGAKSRDSLAIKQTESPRVKPSRSPNVDLDGSEDVKEAVTPKRRVVSDTNWRKDRTPKDESVTPTKDVATQKDTTPKPRIVRRSVVSLGMKVPPSVQDFKENAEQRPTRVRPLRRRSRSGSVSGDDKDGREKTPDFESSGVKIYIKRRRKSKAADEEAKTHKAFNTSESSLTVPSSLNKAASATDITTPDATPTRERPSRIRTEPRIRSLKRSPADERGPERFDKLVSDAEESPRRLSKRKSRFPAGEEEDRPRSAPTSISKDSASESFKKPPRPVPKVYGNRIEGWLAEMPDDPFVEPSDPFSAAESHELLRTDRRQAGDSDGKTRRMRSKTGREQGQLDQSPQEDEGANISINQWLSGAAQTTTQKAARRSTYSPTKSRRLGASGSYEDDDVIREDYDDRVNRPARSQDADFSAAKASIRRSSKRHTYGELSDRPIPTTGHRLSTIASVSTLHSLAKPGGPRAPSNDTGRQRSLPTESVLSRASDGDEPTRNTTVLRRRLTKHTDLMSVLSLDDDNDVSSRRSVRSRRPRHDTARVGDLMNEVSNEELNYQRELRTLVDGVIPVLLQYVVSQDDSTHKLGAEGDPSLTQPIIEMGVALERLKASHKRIPMHDPNELLRWAESTAKMYADYLRVWRLGFNDVVVNLAPAERTKADGSRSWDDDLQRNEHGDLLGGDGERVDVAYLLKRPLVRVKSLSKTFRGIDQAQPSALAEDMVTIYEELVTQARQRNNDERARLEDEAASAIDPSRARDPRNLAPLGGVNIDPTRRVRARDFFDLDLYHSSGQQLGCRIEAIMRDDTLDRGTSGDILFCEVSEAGRWLLFPPVLVSNVSARKGDKDGEIVVMLRGLLADGPAWRELLSLQSSETQSAEWIDMLGSSPMPPRLVRQSSFNALRGSHARRDVGTSSTDSELPIGEQAKPTAPQWDGSDVNSVSNDMPPTSTSRGALAKIQNMLSGSPREHNEANNNKHIQRPDEREIRRVHERSRSEWIPNERSIGQNARGTWFSDHEGHEESIAEDNNDQPVRRPTVRRRTSSVPSMDLPTVNKLRKTLTRENSNKESSNRRVESTPVAKTIKEPTSAPSKLQKRPLPPPPPDETQDRQSRTTDSRPATGGTGLGAIPSFTPAFLKRQRRTSSPLKHEYEPSTASDSSSESGSSDEEDDKSITSESTADEAVSTLGELKDFGRFGAPRPLSRPLPPPPPSFDIDEDTLGPSESASQAPYRKVPPANTSCAKSVACLFSWSDRGSWDKLHPEECEIVVTPGMIEAFDLAQAHAVADNSLDHNEQSPSARGVKPLVAFELTPWVPLRRGTALDISVRSPPTSNSVLRNGSNIMFRSRSPEECEKLYNLINRARIDNPTWIALQNARGPTKTSNWAEVMDRRNAERSETGSSSWLKSLSRKGSTYRSKGARSASVAGSQSSVGTLNSAFSAIRQFSGSSNRIFNIAKSTIMSKQSTRSSYSDSLSSGAATPLPIDPSMGTPLGITNAKVRLYLRETTTKWRDLGHARLTIVLPARPDPSVPADPRTTGLEKRVLVCGRKGNMLLDVTLGESCFERVARTGIAVSVWEEAVGPNGEIGHAAATGGVVSSKSMVYMIQMKSEREAAFTFSMVGKLRY